MSVYGNETHVGHVHCSYSLAAVAKTPKEDKHVYQPESDLRICCGVLAPCDHGARITNTFGLGQPAATFWPIPAVGSGQTYWWYYEWHGGRYQACDGTTNNRPVAIAAQYLSDGAFGDPNLLSLSFFKQYSCTYWGQGRDVLLRRYAKGLMPSNTRIKDMNDPSNYTDRFFGFRGDSEWLPLRTSPTYHVTTDFYGPNNQLRYQINGRYAFASELGRYPFLGGLKYTYDVSLTVQDNAELPTYPILPDRLLDADIVLSRDSGVRKVNGVPTGDDMPVYCNYPTYAGDPETAWRNERVYPNLCTIPPNRARWAMYIRKSQETFEGKSILYVGYSETTEGTSGAPIGPGACEEWWYAQDIGPISVLNYGIRTFAECTSQYLAPSGPSLTNRAAHIFYALYDAVDSLELRDRCIGSGCKVTWPP